MPDDGRIAISIDDGRGFDSADQAPWSITSRAQELGGSLRLDTGKPVGAHMTISLPGS